MSDRKLTLLELHFDGGFQIGPKTVGGLGGDEDVEDDEEAETIDVDVDDEGGGGPGAVIAGLLALAVVAALARKLLGGGDDLDIETPEGDVEASGDVEEFESAD